MCSDLFVNCIWIAEIFQAKSCDGGLPNPTEPLPVFHHTPSYVQQIDILVSKNQVLQIIHLKHHDNVQYIKLHRLSWITI